MPRTIPKRIEQRTERIIREPEEFIPPTLLDDDGISNYQYALNEVAIDRELGRRSLHEFVKMAWPVIDPAVFMDGFHIELICKYLEKCYRREIRKLVINVPPRHCKSSIVAVLFPIWCWINNPELRFFIFSYAMTRCEDDSVKCRRLVESQWFFERWGDVVELREDQNQKRKYETSKGGYRAISSVCGPVTGEGGDFLIMDDPHNVVEGESPAVRDATVQWWREAVGSRLNDERTGVKIIIQQRVHDLDLAGEMIRDGYEHLILPFEYEKDHPFLHPEDPRKKDGEILWPAKFGPKEVQDKKISMGSYAYGGQYQQRPSPREGGMFQDLWFDGKIVPKSSVPEGGITVRGWDIAAGTAKDSAYTCGCKIKRVGNNFYIMDCARFRLTPGKLENRIKQIVMVDGMSVDRQSFPQDPGAAGKMAIKNLLNVLIGYPVSYSPETGAKETRAMAFAAQVELGFVYLVEGSWNEVFRKECAAFPNGRYVDQVDAASRAFHQILAIERLGWGSSVSGTLNIPITGNGILQRRSVQSMESDDPDSFQFDLKSLPVVSSPIVT